MLISTMGTIISDSIAVCNAPTRDEVTTMPSTRRSAKDCTTLFSRAGSAFESAKNTA